jgi:hypothetical protein
MPTTIAAAANAPSTSFLIEKTPIARF